MFRPSRGKSSSTQSTQTGYLAFWRVWSPPQKQNAILWVKQQFSAGRGRNRPWATPGA